jgi:hypothetical protein
VSEVQHAASTGGIVYFFLPEDGMPRGAKLEGNDFTEWQVRWNAFAADEREVEFVVTVEAVGTVPASARFTLKTHRLSDDFSRRLGLIDEDFIDTDS